MFSSVIVVALGANLPDARGRAPLETCVAAAAAVASLPGLSLRCTSQWYRTRPVPASEQPDYVNGCLRLEGEIDPAALLTALQQIEAVAGRRRGVANAARPLDLDIIAVGDLVRDAPDPVVPHPRMHLRPFVLKPMYDVAPYWTHPILGRRTGDLLAALPDDVSLEIAIA